MEQIIRARDITLGLGNAEDILQNLRPAPVNLSRYCLLPSELSNLFYDYGTALEKNIIFFCKLTTKYKYISNKKNQRSITFL